jgi:hypothetical protein
MYNRSILILLLAAETCLPRASGSAYKAFSNTQEKPCPAPTRSLFRYAITYNDEIEYTAPGGATATYRVVDVLLAPKSFSEATLRQLFQLLSKRFLKSDKLTVHVHTNLEDVYTPEESEQILPKAQCNTLAGDKYPWAIYNRTHEYEGFSYSTNEPGSTTKTIKLGSPVP